MIKIILFNFSGIKNRRKPDIIYEKVSEVEIIILFDNFFIEIIL